MIDGVGVSLGQIYDGLAIALPRSAPPSRDRRRMPLTRLSIIGTPISVGMVHAATVGDRRAAPVNR